MADAKTAGIRLQDVSKSFQRAHTEQTYTLQETVLRGFRRRPPPERFWVLRDVSFDVAAGEMVAIVGRNGVGKSSLLRLVGGIGKPDSGTITVNGRLGALIDLGAGYHSELTGRENVYMNGVISGCSRKQVTAMYDDIVAFAELGPFMDNPFRTYSSGMQLRLAFSVAVHVQPEVLLVDEVLAVGDLGFQRKCLDRIEQLRQDGAAILLVTHDLEQAERICDTVIWLNNGQIAARGPAVQVVEAYRTAMQKATQAVTPAAEDAGGRLQLNVNRFGSQEVMVENVRLEDGQGVPVEQLPHSGRLAVDFGWRVALAAQSLGEVVFSVALQRTDGLLVCEVFSPPGRLPGECGRLRLDFDRLDLSAGSYFVNVGAYPADYAHGYDYHWQVYTLEVPAEGTETKGLLRPPHHWEMIGQRH